MFTNAQRLTNQSSNIISLLGENIAKVYIYNYAGAIGYILSPQ